MVVGILVVGRVVRWRHVIVVSPVVQIVGRVGMHSGCPNLAVRSVRFVRAVPVTAAPIAVSAPLPVPQRCVLAAVPVGPVVAVVIVPPVQFEPCISAVVLVSE